MIESESPVLVLFPSSRVILLALRTGVTMLQAPRPRDVQPVLTMLPWLTELRAVPADVAQRLVLTALLVLTVPLIASMEAVQRLVLTALLLLTVQRAVPMAGRPRMVMSAVPLLTGCTVEQIAQGEAASPPQAGSAVDWDAECLRDESQPLG